MGSMLRRSVVVMLLLVCAFAAAAGSAGARAQATTLHLYSPFGPGGLAEAFHGSGITAIEQKKASGLDPTHGARAASRRSEANITRKREAREWDEQHGKLVDPFAFQREILPLIQGISLSRLQRVTGLSLRYVSLIRRGERTPHPRHWQRFLSAGAAD